MSDFLIHYRTPGSKNGVRLYQYKDGRLTPAGIRRYLKGGLKGGTVSKEYEEELDFNSQQNIYFGEENKPKPKSKRSKSKPTSKADQVGKKVSGPGYEKPSYSGGYRTKDYDGQSVKFRSRRSELRRKTSPLYPIGLMAGGIADAFKQHIKKVKNHINKFFENSFNKHFGYQMTPPKGSDGINHLIPYTNKEAADALNAYTNSLTSGKMGDYINTFIQTSQMNIANGCARFLDAIGMDDKVFRFLKKLGIKDNNDIIIDQLRR